MQRSSQLNAKKSCSCFEMNLSRNICAHLSQNSVPSKMYYIWLAFSNFKCLFLTISVLYFKHNKGVAKRGYTKVFCRMNDPLKMLSCRFRYFKFSSMNIAFVKQFMIKPPFQNRKFSCLTKFCDLATLDSKFTTC